MADAAIKKYLSPTQVCELIPGMTKSNLAGMRFRGVGPKFMKPTPQVVVYSEDEVLAWLENSIRTSTAS